MALLPPIHNIPEICSKKGIETAIICPGSRSAALTISFVRHPKIKTFTISDERSAAFIALGMAQLTKKPVVLICTSGTAALNFAPAIAEAYFQEIPLLVLTADRPDEWINQYDGQTIFQREIYGKHVKKSYHFPADYTHKDSVWFMERSLNEAINLTVTEPKAPVHINIPIREPFYPAENEVISFDTHVKTIVSPKVEKSLSSETWAELLEIWQKSERKLIAVGQQDADDELNKILQLFENDLGTVVIGDNISNIHRNESEFIGLHDNFLSKNTDESLQPDLMITIGKSFISKHLKLFLRKFKPAYHFHIQENSEIFDPFQTITHHLPILANYFLNTFFDDIDRQNFKEGDEEEDTDYLGSWKNYEHRILRKNLDFLRQAKFSDLKAYELIINELPKQSVIHLGNSMAVRYANMFKWDSSKNLVFYCNRGTSGIEGSLSTAVGQALSTDKLVVCILGDVSFLYDRNALWNNYLPKNLRIIVLNNQGGNIFRIIDGSSHQPELKEYFETHQLENCELVAKQAKIAYCSATNEIELSNKLENFFDDDTSPKLLEVFTNPVINKQVLAEFKA